MEDTRKYFDYELAYEGYLKAKELFDKGGLEELVNSADFDISGGGVDYIGSIEQWASNGYIPIVASAYNITLYVIDKNFDTDTEEKDWYISGEVDMISYSYGEDNLYINNKGAIEDRIGRLLDYAKENNYTIGDYEKELESLEKVLEKLQ
ncbi:MAG: hypothetical protein IKC22_00730 [Bacilli bacterium]|nr:hypothetical protein [Romboutsia sp.]MBR0369368.1 hypothetical protein [Methanobrevibacter sp.]MBR2652837.1 hypothetical protein [bacterium]MBR2890907.1 hypothetical protein [Bacilli bacterium]